MFWGIYHIVVFKYTSSNATLYDIYHDNTMVFPGFYILVVYYI